MTVTPSDLEQVRIVRTWIAKLKRKRLGLTIDDRVITDIRVVADAYGRLYSKITLKTIYSRIYVGFAYREEADIHGFEESHEMYALLRDIYDVLPSLQKVDDTVTVNVALKPQTVKVRAL